LPHIKAFHVNFTVEVGVGDVNGEQAMVSVCGICNDNLLASHACNGGKGVMEVSAFALGEVLGHQAGFVPGDLPIVPSLDTEDLFTSYGLSAFGELC
jgi:hypothetical protein